MQLRSSPSWPTRGWSAPGRNAAGGSRPDQPSPTNRCPTEPTSNRPRPRARRALSGDDPLEDDRDAPELHRRLVRV